jgi:probable phosphoglycerate mutase
LPKRSPFDDAFLTGDPTAGELVLVRHGQQDIPVDAGENFALWRDPPLSQVGVRQAAAVSAALADRPVAAVYASPLLRASATGSAVAAPHGLPVTVVDDLREVELFQGLPPGTTPQAHYGSERMKAAGSAFVATRRWDAYPDSETGFEVRARFVPAIDAILSAHPGEVVVVACHGGVIGTYASAVLGIEDTDMIVRAAHASMHRFVFSGPRRVLGSLNDVHHLVPDDELLTW